MTIAAIVLAAAALIASAWSLAWCARVSRWLLLLWEQQQPGIRSRNTASARPRQKAKYGNRKEAGDG